MAIASSFMNRPVPPDTIVLGEVGLGGEVRGVSRIETRLKEAIHMGFRRCILPKRNCKGLSGHYAEKIQSVGVELVDEAIREIFG
jgi:DNA repair protein RadA/Sms